MKVENPQISTNYLNISVTLSIFYLSRKHLFLERGAKSKTSMHSSAQGYSVWLGLPFTDNEMLMVHGGKELVMLEMQNRFQIESAISNS